MHDTQHCDLCVIIFLLFLCVSSDKTGKLTCSKVAEGSKIKINLLDSNDVFILDEGFQVFVWVGKSASPEERKNAMVSAVNYLGVANRPKYTPVVRIIEGGLYFVRR